MIGQFKIAPDLPINTILPLGMIVLFSPIEKFLGNGGILAWAILPNLDI